MNDKKNHSIYNCQIITHLPPKVTFSIESTYIGNKQRYNFKQRYNLNVTFVFDIVKYIKTYTLTYILTDKFDKMNAKGNEMQTLNLEKKY